MMDSEARPFPKKALWWLLLPILSIFELGAQIAIDRNVAPMEDWKAAAEAVRKEHRSGDLVVIAPWWATHARLALKELTPIEDQARADASTYTRLWEVSIRGSEAEEAKGLNPEWEARFGRVRVRRFMLPRPARVSYRFLHHIDQAKVSIVSRNGAESPCAWSANVSVWRCTRQSEIWIGPLVFDDLHFRPREAIWAHPLSGVVTRITFSDVPPGRKIYGYTSIRYRAAREGNKPPVVLDVVVDGQRRQRITHHDLDGWKHFEVPLAGATGPMEVRFEVSCPSIINRHFGFIADVRD